MDTPTTRSLWGKLRSKEYRDAFVDSTIGNVISAQIFAIRKKMNWNQGDLAVRCSMAQERISVMENPDYQNFSLKTLKRLAAAFDVALLVRFVPYSELVRWTEDESRESLAVPSYEEDSAREVKPIRAEPYRKTSKGSAGPVVDTGHNHHSTGSTASQSPAVIAA